MIWTNFRLNFPIKEKEKEKKIIFDFYTQNIKDKNNAFISHRYDNLNWYLRQLVQVFVGYRILDKIQIVKNKKLSNIE